MMAGIRSASAGTCKSAAARRDAALRTRVADRKEKQLPAAVLLQQVAGKIILMETLHDDEDMTLALTIEAALDRLVEPVLHRSALGLRTDLAGIDRVVDDDQISATAGRHAADRRRDAVAVECGGDLALRDFDPELEARERFLKERILHDPREIAREVPRQLVVVAGAENPLLRIAAHDPGREQHERSSTSAPAAAG